MLLLHAGGNSLEMYTVDGPQDERETCRLANNSSLDKKCKDKRPNLSTELKESRKGAIHTQFTSCYLGDHLAVIVFLQYYLPQLSNRCQLQMHNLAIDTVLTFSKCYFP